MKKIAKIFIPFLDGLLNYDCKHCDYNCCYSGSIIMNNREKKKIFSGYPYLRHFFTKKTDKLYALHKYNICWFVKDGLCQIQKKYGYRYKPFVCRLDPFYVYRCNDEYVAMEMAGRDKCPMLGVGKISNPVSHRQILKNTREAIDCNFIYAQINWPKGRLALEKKILKDSRGFLKRPDYLDFAAHQIALAGKDTAIAKIKSGLSDTLNLWRSFLKVDSLKMKNKRLTYELTVLTSMLRLENPRLRNMQPPRVPLALLALYFYMLLFLKNQGARTYLRTYQEMLDDVALGLLYLKKDDLRFREFPLETKIAYLRKLQAAHLRHERNPIQKIQP
ncbi:hypothetical protein ACFLZ3_04070 [Candidatus Omnitrophota bacterium]